MSDTIQYKGYTIKVETENDPMNPRHEWDNFATMFCAQRRHNLGDKKVELSNGEILNSNNFHGWKDMIDHVDNVEGGIIFLPLYLYDHSGITINTTGFSSYDPEGWDSGCVGLIFISKAKARKEFGWKVINKARVTKLREIMLAEVSIYDDYLTGAVYGFQNVNPEGEEVDSCYGFYGSDHEVSGLLEAARDNIDWQIKNTLKTVGVQQELALS